MEKYFGGNHTKTKNQMQANVETDLAFFESFYTQNNTDNTQKSFINTYLQIKKAVSEKVKEISETPSKQSIFELNNKIVDSKTHSEIIEELQANETEIVDIRQLGSKQKAKINEIITKNFPLVEVSRLIPGQKIININIGGIKQINDVAGQNFTDRVSLKLREILRTKFEQNSYNQSGISRIIKSDYKNITLLTDSQNNLENIFGDISEKNTIIQEVVDSLEYEIIQNSKKIIQQKIRSGEIGDKTNKDLNKLIQQNIHDTKHVIIAHLQFGLGATIIPNEMDNIVKIDSVRKAEITSRPRKSGNKVEIVEYDEAEILSILEKSMRIEKEILQEYHGKTFIFEGISYNAIIGTEGKLRISPELLRYVRKYKNKIIPPDLVHKISEYIDTLNDGIDFISPIRGGMSLYKKEFDRAFEINAQIRQGIVESKYFTHNYKGGLCKEAFFTSIDGKNGIKAFIDIKDMGIDNLTDFSWRSKQILHLHEEFQNGKITKEYYERKKSILYLEAGKNVTDRFIEAQKGIKMKYPESIISFGGDEIYLFIPQIGDQAIDESILSQDLNSIFYSTTQQARIVFDTTEETISSKNIFGKLDLLSKINKMYEEAIEKQFMKQGKHLKDLPHSTYLTMSKRAKSILFQKGFDMDNFMKMLKGSIKKFDAFNVKQKLCIGDDTEGIYLLISREPNNSIQLSLI